MILNIKNTIIVLIISIFSVSGFILLVQPPVSVSAAPPGCYVQSRGANATTLVTERANCPSGASSADAAYFASRCRVAIVNNQGQTPFREVPCDTLTVGSVEINPTLDTTRPNVDTTDSIPDDPIALPQTPGRDQCGKGSRTVDVGFNIGCRGEEWPREQLNPIVDMAFAVFRVLSAGVGLVVIGSIIVAGIQYAASRGNPQSTQAAISRVTNAVIALLIYLFMFAIANFLVPGGMFV